MRRWLRFTLLATVLVVFATWPWLLLARDHVGQVVVDPDFQCGMWWPSQFADAVLHLRSPFFDQDLFWPAGQDVTLLIWNFGAQLVLLPIHALAGPPLGTNLASLATLVLNALAAAWAGRVVTRSDAGALAGLIVGATDMFAFSEGLAGRPEQALWAPNAVYLGSLAMLAQEPGRRRWIVAGAASLAASGAIYWFYAYFIVILTIGLTVVRVARRQLTVRGLRDLFTTGALSLLFVLPFLLPVLLAVPEGAATYTALKAAAADGYKQQAMASLAPGNLVWPLFPARELSRDLSLILVPVLGYAALRGRGAVREIACMGLVAVVFAMGPLLGTLGNARAGESYVGGTPLRIAGGVVYLPGLLLGVLPGYDRFWWPYRWLGVALPAMSVCAAWIVARSPRRNLLLVLLALGGTAQLAGALRTRPEFAFPFEDPAVFHAIAEMPSPAPVLQMPFGASSNGYVGYQALHRQPIDAGIAMHIPGDRSRLPSSALVTALEAARLTSATPVWRTWTSEETGGYHYVIVYGQGDLSKRRREHDAVFRVLGPPFYQGEYISAWAVPGVGTIPAGYALETPRPGVAL